MKIYFTERKIVVALFVIVLVTFSLAQEDSKKMEKMYSGAAGTSASRFVAAQLQVPATSFSPAAISE